MFVKLIAILFILIGIVGLILPVLPGILMITIGILLLYRERHEEIHKMVNEKAPGALADFYNNFLHKITVPPFYTGVDWHWVKKEVLRTEGADKIRPVLDRYMRKARALAVPKYIHEEKKIERLDEHSITIEGAVTFLTNRIGQYIKGAESIVVFALTIGEEIEKEASALMAGGDEVGGYLLDRIGSFAAESLAENLEKKLRSHYSAHKKSVSSRFSPGYCDWPVEEQLKIAKLIDLSKIGIRLTEGCMMVPKKSISAIVAVAGEGIFKEFISSCNICEKEDCGYRRAV